MTSFRPHARLIAAALSVFAGCGARIVGGPGENTLTVGSTGQGELTPSDPRMSLPLRSGMFTTDVWTVELTIHEPVTIAMCENFGVDIDPYLVVDANPTDPHSNDDSGGGYHGHGSLISFTPNQTGTYTIYASTFRSQLTTSGTYTLQVMAGAMTTFRCPS